MLHKIALYYLIPIAPRGNASEPILFSVQQNGGMLLRTNYPVNVYHCEDRLQERCNFSKFYKKELEETEIARR